MPPNKVNPDRRKVVLSALGVSVLGVALPTKWSKPVINAVVTPAHAETSPGSDPDPGPIPVCPDLVVGNAVITSAVSGQPVGSCSISFDILSSDPAEPLNVTSIANNAAAGVIINVSAPTGVVTDSNGINITWIDVAPVCSGTVAQIINDVTFTITAECDNGGDPVELVVALTDLAGVSLA